MTLPEVTLTRRSNWNIIIMERRFINRRKRYWSNSEEAMVGISLRWPRWRLKVLKISIRHRDADILRILVNVLCNNFACLLTARKSWGCLRILCHLIFFKVKKQLTLQYIPTLLEKLLLGALGLFIPIIKLRPAKTWSKTATASSEMAVHSTITNKNVENWSILSQVSPMASSYHQFLNKFESKRKTIQDQILILIKVVEEIIETITILIKCSINLSWTVINLLPVLMLL